MLILGILDIFLSILVLNPLGAFFALVERNTYPIFVLGIVAQRRFGWTSEF